MLTGGGSDWIVLEDTPPDGLGPLDSGTDGLLDPVTGLSGVEDCGLVTVTVSR